MVDDELPPDASDDPLTPPGPRRSTYTPPPTGAGYDPGATDDDALAGALSEEFQRWAPPTGPISTLTAEESVPSAPSSPSVSPPPDAPDVFSPPPAAPDVFSPPTAPPAVFSPAPTPPPAPPVVAPDQLPPAPQRISLTDAELLQAADLDAPDHDTAALLDLVERELELRQVEARRLGEWEQQVRAADVPDAEELVSRVREQFTGVIPIIAPAVATGPDVEGAAVAGSPPIADQAAFASPPLSPVASPFSAPPAGPRIEISLADAPPPYGIVPSAVVPPPSVPAPSPHDPTEVEVPAYDAVEDEGIDDVAPPVGVPALVEPGIPIAAAGGTALLFDELLRETAPDAALEPARDAVADPVAEPAGEPAGEPGFEAPSPPAMSPSAAAAASDGAGANWSLSEEQSSVTEAAPHDTPAVGPRAARVEVSALEPTPVEQRAGRSVRLFWLWFAVNASVVSIALGAVIVGLGVSLRQAVLATLIGVAISFLPLGLGTLAGKWSGQPTMVVSRATFGIAGNALPALLALVTRLAWAAALLWMLGAGVAEVLVGSGLVDGVGRLELTIAAAGVGLVLAALVAGFGFGMIALVSAIVSVLSFVLVVGLIVLTASYVDLDAALSVPDGDWLLLVSGSVLVFSVVGLAWANSSGDLARYQAKGTYGSSAVLFTAFGATIPAFLLISWGAILAASNPTLAQGLQSNPLDLIARVLPLWYPVPLVAAVALSLISAAALALYSGGFALLATGLRAPRPVGVLVIVVLAGALVAVLIAVVPDAAALFRDVVTTLAVPVAAWAGIFGAETMIRTRRVHSPSLLRSGGVYPAVRWVNLVMLLVITGIGWGLSTAAVVGLQWQGYLFTLLGVDTADSLAASDPGVLVALLLGLLTPLVAGIPALRRLQTAERAAAEAEAASGFDPLVPTETVAVE